MTRNQNLRIQLLEVSDRLLNHRLVRPAEMVATHHGVQWGTAAQFGGVFRGVDGSGVAAACEDDDAFAWSCCQWIMRIGGRSRIGYL